MAKQTQTAQSELENVPGDDSPDESSLVECAVLMDCIHGKHDDIIELPDAQARAAEKAGFVDTHPNAIAAIRAGV